MMIRRRTTVLTFITFVAAVTTACARRAVPDDITVIDAASTTDDCGATAFAARDDAARSTSDGALCSVNGWCWEEPFPHGNAIDSFWASSTTDAWAVTSVHDLLRWDGSRWRVEEPLTDLSPRAIGGFQRDRLWMAGASSTGVLRAAFWNGMFWSGLATLMGNGQNARVWHASMDEAWIDAERSMHWEPNWRDRTPAGLVRQHLFHAGATEFAYDETGELRRWSGVTWQAVPSVRDAAAGAFSPIVFGGTSADDVWAFALDPSIARHWDGTQWNSTATNISAETSPIDLVVNPSLGLLLLGHRSIGLDPLLWQFDGTTSTWSRLTTPAIGLARLADTPTSALWLYGTRGAIVHRDGADWTEISGRSALAPDASWFGVGGVDDDNVWAVGTVPGGSPVARIARRDASGWHDDWRGDGALLTIAANTVDDVWAAGATGPSGAFRSLVVHWDGAAWNPVDVPITPTPEEWVRVASSGPRDVWLAGKTALAHFDGIAWSRVDIDGADAGGSYQYADVSARSPDDVWVVGGPVQMDGGTVIASHWDGSRWRSEHVVDFQRTPAGLPSPRIVVGAGDEAWILGLDRVWHRVGSTWIAETQFFAYIGWRGCAGDAWFATSNVIHHVESGARSTMTLGAFGGAAAGWTSRAGTSWVVTGDGGILRRDAR